MSLIVIWKGAAIVIVLKKISKAKLAIIILAVLFLISIGGLVARYVYLTYFSTARATAMVPDNLIGSNPAESVLEYDSPNPILSNQAQLSQTSTSKPSVSESKTKTTDNAKASKGNTLSPEAKAVKLELYKGHAGDNERFEARNLFPGDTESKYFCVKTYHSADVDLVFRAKITKETKLLGKVLHIKVTHLETGKALCDASFSEINGKKFSELLSKNATKETIANYRIDVSLDTSVGNEYQAALLIADFEWFVEYDDGLTDLPQTGDDLNTYLWVGLISVSLFMLVLLWKFRKESADEQQLENC